ncbi:DHS-like NAD/FAD-binding domain-containing protein [Lenzites betulinus]|nr:DHS-like NAD/FAD-binding domain-containing protein [Lenzites betulinus]
MSSELEGMKAYSENSIIHEVDPDKIQAFRDALSKAKRIVVLAGAGLSAGSGVPTFRGKGGLWRNHDVLSLATPAAFIGNPSRIWQFHHHRRETMLKAVPNPAHIALAKFLIPEVRHKISPESSFTLITQNIDGLDRRAIDQVYADAGKPSPLSSSTAHEAVPSDDPLLIEMHGNIAGVLCTNYECKHRELNFTSPICPALEGTELFVNTSNTTTAAAAQSTGRKRSAAEARAWAEARLVGLKQEKDSSKGDTDEPDIPLEDLPRCAKCGALARPDVVWFTEVPQHIEEIMRIIENADMCIVVGTSAVVHPAATFSAKVKEHGGTVAVFNIEPGKRDDVADFVFLGPCEDILPRALDVAHL